MARGELTLKDAGTVHQAVAAAEAATGVEMCVAVANAAGSDPSRFAHAAFADLGLATRNAALVMVIPDARAVEIRTSVEAATVITDETCRTVITEMRIPFKRDAIAEGIVAGMRVLTESVGLSPPAVRAELV